jgi:hypothetical protein
LLVAFRESYAESMNFFYLGLWPVHLAVLIFGIVLFRFEGQVPMLKFNFRQRLKTIAVVFAIFALLIWLSA